MSETKKWGFMKKGFDLIRRGFNMNNPNPEEVQTTQVSNDNNNDSIYISRLSDLITNRMYNFDSKIIKYEQNKDQALLNLPSLIDRYRDLAQESEINEAINIITEEVIHPDYNNEIITINLNELEEEYQNKQIIEDIRESFEKILDLLNFEKNAYKYFRDWYIDGRICFESVYNADDIKQGIQDIIQVDPIKLKKFYLDEHKKVFYELEEIDYINTSQISSFSTGSALNKSYNVKKVLLDERFITYINSGLWDAKLNTYISYLHSVMAPMNKLKLLEMAILIYRLVRAPERRVYYIDVEGLSTSQKEQYINGIMQKFRNETTYNSNGDELINKKNTFSAEKDFFIPVEGGQSGTRIEQLTGGANLGELDDLEYFAGKVKKALNIPKSRWEDGGFTLGRSNEITQEEVKFSKFSKRCRNYFSELIYDLLKKDLIARDIISNDKEWKKIKRFIKIIWSKTNHFDELLEQELLESRINLLSKVEQYVGKYFTHKDIFLDILKYDDERMQEVAKENNLDIDNLSLMDDDAKGTEGPDDIDSDFGGGDIDFGDDFDLDEDFEDIEGEEDLEDVGPEEFSLDDLDEELPEDEEV